MRKFNSRLRAFIFSALLFMFLAGAARAAGLGKMGCVNPVADGTVIKFEKGLVKISQLEDGIIRVRATGRDQFEADQSFALAPDAPRPKSIKVTETEEGVAFETALLKGVISRDNGTIKIYDRSGKLLMEEPKEGGISFDSGKPGVVRVVPADEHFYGFGEKTGPLDKRGTMMTMWNLDNVYTVNAEPLYQSHPYYLALRKGTAYGVFQDNSYKSVFDVGKSNPQRLSYRADGGELNYYFLYGPGPKEVIQRYGMVVGRYPLPPLWATGYMQCRYSYRDEGEVRAITGKFRKNNVPCDVIFLDIHYMDHYKVFSFDKKAFPDPAGLIAELEKQGFKVIVIVDPGVKVEKGYPVYEQGLANDYFVHNKGGGNFQARVWPGDVYFPDFLKPEVRDWWGSLHKFYTDLGVDGIWNDMNEPAGWERDVRPVPDLMVPSGKVPWLDMVHGPKDAPVEHAKVHNAYALLEAEGTYNGLKKLKPNDRPFIITRAGYPGIQRFSSVWTGDNSATWGHLQLSVPMLLNLGVSGVTMDGADIGGFVSNPTPEMYARWLQLGVFYPFCRTHTAIYMPSQDPFSYGPEVLTVSRAAIDLRYRLLPYTYSYFKTASETGLPVMRPMYLEFPDDEKTYQEAEQFMWGAGLLVAPVIREKARSKEIYLPAGKWYKFESAAMVQGPKQISEPVELATIPLFVREGAIIPLAPVMNYTSEKPWSPLTVQFYASDKKSCFSLYEDDGRSFDYLNGSFLKTEFCQEPVSRGLVLSKKEGEGKYQPAGRELYFKVFGAGKPESVQLNTGAGWEKAAYSFDPKDGTLELRVKDQVKAIEVRVNY
jgi:alpha-glucosidase